MSNKDLERHMQGYSNDAGEAEYEDATSDKMDQDSAGYLGPDSGPFRCGNCLNFRDGLCTKVSGDIDADGCCNLFESANQMTAGAARRSSGGEEQWTTRNSSQVKG